MSYTPMLIFTVNADYIQSVIQLVILLTFALFAPGRMPLRSGSDTDICSLLYDPYCNSDYEIC